jgi:hypothetical protein
VRLALIQAEALRDAGCIRGEYGPGCSTDLEVIMQTQNNGKLAFTVVWEAREGKAEAAADIIARFAPEARKEPGLELLAVN